MKSKAFKPLMNGTPALTELRYYVSDLFLPPAGKKWQPRQTQKRISFTRRENSSAAQETNCSDEPAGTVPQVANSAA